MSLASSARALLRDPRWQCALLAGLVMLPLIAQQAVQTPDTFEVTPAFYAGCIAGFLYDGERAETKRVGAVAGCIAALPILLAVGWYAADLAGYQASLWFTTAAALFVVFVHLAFVALAGLVGLLGALLGRWIVGKTGRPRLPVVHT